MNNISGKLTKFQIPQQTTLQTLKQCSENKQAFNALVKIEQNLTIRDNLEQGVLIQYSGKKLEIIPQIIRILEYFLSLTSVEMEKYQVQVLAGDLYEKFKSDTLEDIILMLKMARQGDFGKVFKVDVFTIMEWVKLYLEQKADEREQMHRRSQATIESTEHTPISGRAKYFHELSEDLQEKFNAINRKGFLPVGATRLLQREQQFREWKKNEPKNL